MYWIATVAFGRPRNDKDMESFGLQQNKESAPERESFDVEKGLSRERTILERFHGRAKAIARVMLFISALSAESIITKEARAEEPGTSIQTEHNLNSPDEQETIESKKNITTSSQWAERYVNNAQAEYEDANIKTKEEARQFIITFVDTFIAEFYLPTEGQILKSSAHTIGKRFYTGDDLNNIAEQAAKMKYIIRNLIVRIYHDEADIPSNESEFYQHRLGQITDIRGTILDQSARRPEISDSDYIKKEIEEMAKKTPKSEKKIKYTEEKRYL